MRSAAAAAGLPLDAGGTHGYAPGASSFSFSLGGGGGRGGAAATSDEVHWAGLAAAGSGGGKGAVSVVAVCAADDGWRSMVVNWALSLERVGIRNYVLFAADDKVRLILLAGNTNIFLSSWSYFVLEITTSLPPPSRRGEQMHAFLTGLGAPSFFYAAATDGGGGGGSATSFASGASAALEGSSLDAVLGTGRDRRDELWVTGGAEGAQALAAKAVRWHRHGKMQWRS